MIPEEHQTLSLRNTENWALRNTTPHMLKMNYCSLKQVACDHLIMSNKPIQSSSDSICSSLLKKRISWLTESKVFRDQKLFHNKIYYCVKKTLYSQLNWLVHGPLSDRFHSILFRCQKEKIMKVNKDFCRYSCTTLGVTICKNKS